MRSTTCWINLNEGRIRFRCKKWILRPLNSCDWVLINSKQWFRFWELPKIMDSSRLQSIKAKYILVIRLVLMILLGCKTSEFMI